MFAKWRNLISLLMALALHCTLYAQPPNNTCTNASFLQLGHSLSGTTQGAGTESVPACTGTTSSNRTVWFIVIGNGSTITISTCGTFFDTQLWVYSGGCSGLSSVACNNNSPCPGYTSASSVSFSSVSGEAYLVRLGGAGAAFGNFTISASSPHPPFQLPDLISSCGMADEADPVESEGGSSCVGQGAWLVLDPYLPSEEQEPLTIHVNFIFWTTQQLLGDGTNGNFNPNDPEDMEFVNGLRNEATRRISNLVYPGDNNTDCFNAPVGQRYMKDAKIRFDIQYYWIPSTYAWNIQNAGNATTYCPAGWVASYRDAVNNLVAANNVREGINVFFGNEAGPYNELMVASTTIDSDIMSDTDCSEFPDLVNLNKRSRVAMNNEFLSYRYLKRYNTADWPATLASHIYQVGRVLVHELGHSLDLRHTGPACHQNIMSNMVWPADKNYLRLDQIRLAHQRLHRSSVRKYVTCASDYDQPRVLSGKHVWTFDTKVYSDIVLKPGADLRICGNVYMPKNGAIHVERGAKLIVDGGKISYNRAEYDDCPLDYWSGIFVWGNKDKMHANVDVENLQLDDPGVVILRNDALIEYASTGIYTRQRDQGWVSDYWGGIIMADESTFLNCRRAAAFMAYQPENISIFSNCNFIADAASNNGTYAGVTMWGVNGVDFKSCTFRDFNGNGIYGVGARFTVSGSDFRSLNNGIHATSDVPLAGVLIAGGPTQPNTFHANHSGIYATNMTAFDAAGNTFTQNYKGVAVEGQTLYEVTNNTFTTNTTAIQNVEAGNGRKRFDCNVVSTGSSNTSASGIGVVGFNSGVIFRDNEFSMAANGRDVSITKRNGAQYPPGEIEDWQGAPFDPAYNLFTQGATTVDILSPQAGTVPFTYWHPQNPSTPRLVPRCPIESGCSPEYNFENDEAFTLGSPGDCLNLPPVQDPCTSKPCLDAIYADITALQAEMDTASAATLPALEAQMSALANLKDRALMGLVNQAVADYDFQAALLLLQADSSRIARRAIVGVHAIKGDSLQAMAALHAIPLDSEEDEDFAAIMTLNIPLRTTGQPPAMTVATEKDMEDIAKGHGALSGYAQALLAVLYDEMFMPFDADAPGALATPDMGQPAPMEGQAQAQRGSDDEVAATLRIYPNPARDLLHVELPAVGAQQQVEVFNSQGTLVHQAAPADKGLIAIPTGHWPVGVYLVVVRQGGVILHTQRLAVQR